MNVIKSGFGLGTKIAIIITLMILLNCCQGWGSSGFDEGHEWIVPRPAAEIHLHIVDGDQEPIPDATVWIYLGNEKIGTTARFIAYDIDKGQPGDRSGNVTLTYLGEEGGGYEVPLNTKGPPKLKAHIEAPGYEERVIDLDELLFVATYRVGETDVEYEGETIQMVIIEHDIVLTEQ